MAATRELPFEAEPDVDQDGEHGDDRRPRVPPAISSLETRGPHHLDAAILDLVAERLLDLGDGILLLLLGPAGAATRISTSFGAPNSWICTSPRSSPCSLARMSREIGRLCLGLDLDERAALEVDAEIEPDLPHEEQAARRSAGPRSTQLIVRKRTKLDLGVRRG